MSLNFYELTVKNKKNITPTAQQITFEIPENLKASFVLQAGQHVSVRVQISENETVSRPYSVLSIDEEGLHIAPKSVKNGLVSNFLHQRIQIGNILQVTAPKGKFVLNESKKNLIFIATGSGIVPILNMIEAALKKENTKILLLFGNSTPEETMFLDQIEALMQKHPDFKTHFFYSQTGKKERIDEKNILEIAQETHFFKAENYYLCGVPAMMENVQAILEKNGVNPTHIFSESFIKKPKPQATEPAKNQEKSEVNIVIGGLKKKFLINKDGSQNILEAANAQGADLPYSCLGGICCSCQAKVLEGEVNMKESLGLDTEMEKKGYILCCQSAPKSEKVLISFDAR